MEQVGGEVLGGLGEAVVVDDHPVARGQQEGLGLTAAELLHGDLTKDAALTPP